MLGIQIHVQQLSVQISGLAQCNHHTRTHTRIHATTAAR